MPIVTREALARIDHHRKHIDSVKSLLHFFHHLASKRRLDAVNTRRVDQNYLDSGTIDDALNAVKRGLRLGGNDGDFAAHQTVYERGFAGVRSPNNRHETGTEG